MWNCLGCGKENRDDRNHCWHCATSKDGCPPEEVEVFERVEKASQSLPSLVSQQAVQPSLTPSSDGAEVKALMKRYWDAYVTARVSDGYGDIIKIIGVVLAVLIALVTLLVASQISGGASFIAMVIGLLFAAFVGVQFYLLGVLVSAQGQILKASLDCAVNSSPFLNNEHRAKIMSLK
ncbi:MAG: hypothetical protein ACRD9S_09475 [Pyrinomonadaceae bacterium]